jgi:hypothetical protein
MGKEKSKPTAKPETKLKDSAMVTFTLDEANAILAVFDLAIRAPNSDINGLSSSKLALNSRLAEAFKE